MVHTETGAGALFDSGELLETFMEDRGIALSILARFLERTEEQLRSLPEIEARGDWQTARREAHSLKGSAFTLSGQELGRIAARLELAYENRDHSEAAAIFPLLDAAFVRFREKAGAWLRNETGEP